MTQRLLLLVAAVAFLAAGCTGAQQAAQPSSSPSASQSDDDASSDLEPFDEVVPDDAEKDEGLFTVYRDDEDLFYQIPDSLLGTELLLVSRIAQTAQDIGYGGEKANTQVVRWQRDGRRVLLRLVTYENQADSTQPIYEAVRNANFEPVLMAFDVKAVGPDTASVVVEVSDLYTTDVPALGLQRSRREQYQVRRLDGARTFVDSVRSFPENIEVRSVLTYEAQEPPSNSATGTISIVMNHSMVMLPRDPMRPRACDDRVGFFSVTFTDYGADTDRAEETCYITRWRLEPSDPEAYARGELVDPVEPIVYYIDPATPERYREALKQGVVDWQVAFEEAGFSNAILAKDPPTEEENPDWSPEDARYSVIRYFPSETQNAYGPHVHDPRTGEILESDIGWFHNVSNLLRNWFFVQTAAANPDARSTAFRDEVMNELVRFVSAHEVGHTLGFPHNWGASYAYPVDSLRSPTFTAEHGTAPSIMDYARFNYVAQPGDGVTNFMPAVGEYDKWATQWGYTRFPDLSADEEEQRLAEWVRERADDPAYYYGRQTIDQTDPRAQREDLGDDAVLASTYGLENLKRIVPMLPEWTYEERTNYDQLREIYGEVLDQWQLYIGHVTRQIGGFYETRKTYDQDGPVFEYVPAETQQRAMAFLQANVFSRPDWLLDRNVLRRIEGAGTLERVRSTQVEALDMLLDPQRLARMIEADVLDEGDVYGPLDMLGALREGLWSELGSSRAIDPFRRNLQRGYIEQMHELMTAEVNTPQIPESFREYYRFTPVDVSQSDIRPLVRGELQTLQQQVTRALRRTDDRLTQLHLQDVQQRIENILDPDSEA